MALLDAIFTRRRQVPRFSALPRRTRQRLSVACDDLTRAEDEMADKLGLNAPPRLMLVDEEEAVILLQADRKCTR
jgi:hypothetical protein